MTPYCHAFVGTKKQARPPWKSCCGHNRRSEEMTKAHILKKAVWSISVVSSITSPPLSPPTPRIPWIPSWNFSSSRHAMQLKNGMHIDLYFYSMLKTQNSSPCPFSHLNLDPNWLNPVEASSFELVQDFPGYLAFLLCFVFAFSQMFYTCLYAGL